MRKRKKKYKSIITQRISRSFKNVSVCFLVLAFLSSLATMRGTNAGFLDEEKSEGNVFGASTLDFSVSSETDFSPKISPSMEILRSISISNEGLEDFQYQLSADNFSGDTALCDALEIKDDLDDTFQSLNSYVSSGTDNLTKTDWNFTIRLIDNDDALADKTCDFDLVAESWQIGLVYGAGGFTDVETVSSEVESEHWTNIADHLVVNEVYYDVDGSHGVETDNEWVEIYNPTSSAVNLRDWEICDGISCDTIALADLDIPANGYAVVTKEASTWGFWTVPGSAVKIALGSTIGNGLSNTGDRLILKDDGGVEIDAMSYGSDTTQLNPACPDVSEGHSLARKPAGQDLDLSSDFEDLSNPNPGTNPHTVVMNEIMPNPTGDDGAHMPSGEWVELYNYGEYDIDLSDWKIRDGDGDELDIKDSNTDIGSTEIKAGEKLVVYRNGDDDFDLEDDGDTISLIDEKDLIKDSHKFEATPEGKTIARFPDAVGPWIDPDGTPGEENKMNENEMEQQILIAYEECFKNNNKLDSKSYSPICQPEYLVYLGLLKKLDGERANVKLVNGIKEKLAQQQKEQEKQEEQEKLETLIEASTEVSILPQEEDVLGDPLVVVDENLQEEVAADNEENADNPENETSEEDLNNDDEEILNDDEEEVESDEIDENEIVPTQNDVIEEEEIMEEEEIIEDDQKEEKKEEVEEPAFSADEKDDEEKEEVKPARIATQSVAGGKDDEEPSDNSITQADEE